MKIGIVGTGSLVNEILPVLYNMSEIEIVAICGTKRSTDVVKDLSNKYEIAYGFTDYEKLLEIEMDAVYIAIPNHLHYEYAVMAIEKGINVIVEKPITCNYDDTLRLKELANNKRVYLFEAITTMYQPNYQKIKELLPEIGDIRCIQCNFSQCSRKYAAFKAGNVFPVFDTKKGGGALMDLNIYNIYFVMGLFGKPVSSAYYPNIEKDIDTSGIFIMDYEKFKAVCIGAKDCSAPLRITIQGTKGYIMLNSSPNICGKVTIHMNNGEEKNYDLNGDNHRIAAEFREFNRILFDDDRDKCEGMLNLSVLVSKVMNTEKK